MFSTTWETFVLFQWGEGGGKCINSFLRLGYHDAFRFVPLPNDFLYDRTKL